MSIIRTRHAVFVFGAVLAATAPLGTGQAETQNKPLILAQGFGAPPVEQEERRQRGEERGRGGGEERQRGGGEERRGGGGEERRGGGEERRGGGEERRRVQEEDRGRGGEERRGGGEERRGGGEERRRVQEEERGRGEERRRGQDEERGRGEERRRVQEEERGRGGGEERGRPQIGQQPPAGIQRQLQSEDEQDRRRGGGEERRRSQDEERGRGGDRQRVEPNQIPGATPPGRTPPQIGGPGAPDGQRAGEGEERRRERREERERVEPGQQPPGRTPPPQIGGTPPAGVTTPPQIGTPTAPGVRPAPGTTSPSQTGTTTAPDDPRAADRDERRRERLEERARRQTTPVEAAKEPLQRPQLPQEEVQRRRQERREFTRDTLKDIARERRERREEGGRVVIEEPDNRRIVRQGDRVIIRHDETERLRDYGRDFRVERGPGGERRNIIVRPDGVTIITVVDDDGRLLRRIRRTREGREFVLIDNDYRDRPRWRDRYRDRSRGGAYFDFYVDLPPPRIRIPRERYYVYADRASYDDIEYALSAPPVEELDDEYTLDEIRYSPRLRERMPSVNLNTINFEFGSWEIGENQVGQLEVMARAIQNILRKNPDEVFLIEGHTDAVGSDEDNLSLSDRRAESVARVLSDEFGIPAENLVTQGYGEQYLLVNTQDAERANRRVEFRRITPLLARGGDDRQGSR